MAGVKLGWGLSSLSEEMQHISEVENGKKCNCVCPDCGTAFFEANTNKSKEFFEGIFENNKWLIGESDGDDSGPGNFGGDDAPDPVYPVDDGPRGFAIDLDDKDRMKILSRFLEPTMFPLTVMEVVPEGA